MSLDLQTAKDLLSELTELRRTDEVAFELRYAELTKENPTLKKMWKAHENTLKKQQNTYYQNSYTQFEGQPLQLECGRWQANEMGIATQIGMMKCEACCHPILPVERLINIDTGTEKLKLAYRKGHRWREIIADKKTLASSTAIIELANAGIAVNAENAKFLIKYLHDIENLNYDTIPEKHSISRLGWIDGYGFSPYMENVVFDGEEGGRIFFEATKPCGSYELWLDLCRELRQKKTVMTKMFLAASFASALVKPLELLPFTLHIWGATGNGKTILMQLAASVWANPAKGKYIQNYNSTNVGLEMLATLTNSMPVMRNELELAKDHLAAVEKETYMHSEGVGRARGSKTGGQQKMNTWANILLSNGEMPITNSKSGGGAVNRIIEIECTENLFDDFGNVIKTVSKNYGHAGRVWIDYVSKNKENLQNTFDIYYTALLKTDTTEKQALAMALILTTDQAITEHIFKDGKALSIDDVGAYLSSKSDVSMNERAYRHIVQFIIMNKNKFCGDSDVHDVWGDIEGAYAYIMFSKFESVIDDIGYSAKALLSWLKSSNLIECQRGNQFKRRINNVPQWCVKLKIHDFWDDLTPVKDDDSLPF